MRWRCEEMRLRSKVRFFSQWPSLSPHKSFVSSSKFSGSWTWAINLKGPLYIHWSRSHWKLQKRIYRRIVRLVVLYKINRYLGVIYLLQNSFNISIFLTLRSITDDCVSIPICVFFLLISFIPDLRLFLAIFFYSLFFNRVSNGLRHIAEEKNAFFFIIC